MIIVCNIAQFQKIEKVETGATTLAVVEAEIGSMENNEEIGSFIGLSNF